LNAEAALGDERVSWRSNLCCIDCMTLRGQYLFKAREPTPS
jgi:hypothetical protein